MFLTASPQSTLSIMDLIATADPIVKAVMLLLVLSSVACWAIVIEKSIRTWRLKSDVKALESLADGATDAAQADGLVRRILTAAELEANDGVSRGEARSEIRARLERAMKQRFKGELELIEFGLPFLATIGSAAPFIGLFGTVWGIMNSFTAIAARQDTSLATVAPGIAEALFATALGLVAAIPAVMAYNHYAVKLGRSVSTWKCGHLRDRKADFAPAWRCRGSRRTAARWKGLLMGMSANVSSGDGEDSSYRPMAEINITPMVDVMLVLLIIFMVAAPLMVTGVPIELPKTTAAKLGQSKKPMVVTLTADGKLQIRNDFVTRDALVGKLREMRAAEGDAVVYVRADKKNPYGEVMDLLGQVGQSGFSRVSLLSQQPGAGAAAASGSPAPAPAPNPSPAP